ncbi:TonB-dependent receptor, partial [Paraburkholderia sp. BR14263]|uniref:TonB-dependent receptor domain-containing protein n=1 Tax=Paraburkholderia sp. BR14263 TaxID=3237000 RepID=UPI0034CD456F
DINGISSGNIQRGFRRVRIGNANTGWQEDMVTNIGIESILWKGKLSITADFYNKKTTGLLFPVTLPDLLGDATPPNANIGDIKNTGYDLTIGSKGKFSKNWRWNLLLTLTHYQNKIIKLNDLTYFDDLGGNIRNEVGYP